MALKADLVPTRAGLNKGSEGVNVERLQNYLERFGYLESEWTKKSEIKSSLAESAPEKKGEFDEQTEKALINFQKFTGLEPTGELDQPTLEKMKQDRCGTLDILPGKATSGEIPSSYVLSGCKWGTTHLRYGFENFSTHLTQAQVRSAMQAAFNLWAAVTPLSFSEVALSQNPEIRIRFGTTGHNGCGYPFTGELAHNFYPPTCGGSQAGDGHYNESYTWSVNSPPSNYDLITIAAHEIGHGLGLAHSTINDALMYPYYSGEHRFLHQDDIDGIQEIYGSAEWLNNQVIQRVYTSHHSQNCWALLQGKGWRKVDTGSVDGTTNLFKNLCYARSSNQEVNLFLENNNIQIMYL
ncbi:hypothetical protein DYD21_06140 [Rhodohalobacter sp. SW132]|uniref:matrixin family metalloprotease n=1 Tax=Rhodohalobacter sp. SW132 TaxID=2293433 RepID=UPI000E27D0B3|nr:matrixin family metalloprotease [Rhodohalobacter sp. SW132]REL38186.1 hypothetical protein DYD21_06140 [Rhodohalobacter sp. SW132]